MKSSTFGERLTEIRKAFGLSMEQFAKEIGYDRSYVSRLESGLSENPSLKFVAAVCSAWMISRDWLENGAGEMTDKVAVSSALAELPKDIDNISPAGLTLLSNEEELCTVNFLKLILRRLPSRARSRLIHELRSAPDIRPDAKKVWNVIILFALAKLAKEGPHPEK